MTEPLLHRIEALPPLPYVAHEILISLNDREMSLRDIAATLAREPGLTARIVSMANAAFYADQRKVYSAEDALVRLGLNRARILTATVLLAHQFDASRCRAFRSEQYWADAVGTAFAAAQLAPLVELPCPKDGAYLGGLLHNIGLFLLSAAFPDETNTALVRHEQDPEQSLAALLRQEAGVDHHEAGRMLLAEWGLPDEIVAVAAHLGQPQYYGSHERLVELVRFACAWRSAGFPADYPSSPRLALTQERMHRLAHVCHKEQEQLEVFAQLLGK